MSNSANTPLDNKNYFIREYETQANKTLKINQIEIGDVGCIVWDSALVLTKYFEKQILNGNLVINSNEKFIELGAGTGIVGLLLATYGANVVLTDLNEILDLLNKNLNENKECLLSECSVKELNWENNEKLAVAFGKQNYIIIADCIYYEQSCEPLIKCLVSLSDHNTVIYCSYEKRDLGKVPEIQEKFFKLASQYFELNLIDKKDLDEFYQSDDIFIYKMKLKLDQSYKDSPITSICILADKSRCPARYVAVEKACDTNTEIDLWKDGLFGKKTNRFICFTKESPINNLYNVVEDIKIINERENVPHGYFALDKTEDTLEKSFQRKSLYVKISPRYFTNEAVCDIITLAKSKRPPAGYLLLGEINGFLICAKYGRIVQTAEAHKPAPHGYAQGVAGYPQATPPPLPPRPPSALPAGQQLEAPAQYGRQSSDLYKTVQRIYEAADNYNPLQGVPFQINPIYNKQLESNNESFDTDMIDKYTRLNELLSKFHYDFNLERSIVGYNE